MAIRLTDLGEKLWTMRQMSEYVRLHPFTLWRLVKHGKFTVGVMKLPRSHWRFSKATLDRWIDRQLEGWR